MISQKRFQLVSTPRALGVQNQPRAPFSSENSIIRGGARVLPPAIIRCIMALEVCQPALPPLLILEMITARLLFQQHFEAEPSLREQALQTAGLVALFTT